MEKLSSDLDSLRQQYETDVEAHATAQQHFQAVSAGLSSAEDGQSASLQDQLMSGYNISFRPPSHGTSSWVGIMGNTIHSVIDTSNVLVLVYYAGSVPHVVMWALSWYVPAAEKAVSKADMDTQEAQMR